MKCAYHPEVDAVGSCVNCGKMICTECTVPLGGKSYCEACAGEVFAKKQEELVGTKSWLTALLFSIFLGWLAVDRFYLGYVGLGILKLLLTILLGVGAIWWLIDIILIATDSLKDAKGQPLRHGAY
ncbi:MAG: TM2 domain-containing protein [Dehalococcoidia bacterium]|nr:MAG: TM2 domain-containing protein [Dehalococcoidia bacterium]